MAVRPRRAHVIRFTLAAAAVAALAVVPTATASATKTPTGTPAAANTGDRQAAANKALVVSFNDQLFNDGNLSVIDTYVAPTYVQHNPTLPNGPAALRQLVISVRAAFPQLHSTTVRALAEGDLVLLENHNVSVPGTKGQANFDIYRVDGGKIVEHWDVLQTEPDTTASGNDMLSQLSRPASDAAPSVVTARDKGIVLNYFTELTQDHDLSAIDRYVAPSLYQHDPTLTNGAAALEQDYTSLFAQYPAFNASVAQVVADGDLVAVHAHVQNVPSDLGQSVVYLYRVVNGKIVEQWDSVQDVPATSANANTMF
jgi:predicted SnoaL-like aldol condensation-catalyzing enzyme